MTEDEITAELDRYGYGPEEQFQLYTLDAEGDRRQIATCESMEAIGTAIKTMGEEGELDGKRVGILDRAEHHWVVNPFAGAPPRW